VLARANEPTHILPPLLNTDPLSPLILSQGVIKLGPYGLTHAVIRHFIFDMATVLWAAQL